MLSSPVVLHPRQSLPHSTGCIKDNSRSCRADRRPCSARMTPTLRRPRRVFVRGRRCCMVVTAARRVFVQQTARRPPLVGWGRGRSTSSCPRTRMARLAVVAQQPAASRNASKAELARTERRSRRIGRSRLMAPHGSTTSTSTTRGSSTRGSHADHRAIAASASRPTAGRARYAQQRGVRDRGSSQSGAGLAEATRISPRCRGTMLLRGSLARIAVVTRATRWSERQSIATIR